MDKNNLEGSQNCLPCESAPNWTACKEKTEEKIPLIADSRDKIFSVLYFLVGYGLVFMFTSYQFWSEGRYLGGFTVFYAVMVLSYLFSKGVKPAAESYFWLAVMLAMGIPFSFWSVLGVLQVLMLIFTAAYWTLSASGRLLLGKKTSQWLFFDWWNSIAVVPFCNLGCQFMILFKKETADEERKENQAISILIGLAIAVPALGIILPLLSSADAGFENIVGDLLIYAREHIALTFVRILLAIPIACYLFGLAYGGISGRNTNRINMRNIRETGKHVRVIPDTAVTTALAVICGVYLIFIGIQGDYLFSAFMGVMPEGFIYSEYARRGFFELCQIAAWNLVILGCAGLFSKTGRADNRGLKVMSVFVSVLTLLLIATAVSKMGMYISVYGLTVNRVLTMVFMIWMAVVFLLVIVRQKKEIPVVRICVMIGAVMFCMLCIFPIEHWIESYNNWARGRGYIF